MTDLIILTDPDTGLVELSHRDERGQGFECWTYWRPEDGATLLRLHDRHVNRTFEIEVPSAELNHALYHPFLYIARPDRRPTAADQPALAGSGD